MKVYLRGFHGPTDWGWVRQYLPLKRVEDTCGITAIDIAENGKGTVACCVMDTWTHSSVQVHLVLADPMVLRHGFFEEVADYVYNVAGRDLMIGLVPSNLERAIRLNKKIGFEEIARVPDAVMDGVDIVVMTMRKDQCRFWKPRPAVAAA